jgi:NADPH:quinone reductase-like Zn-dependent oxidoreductase
VAYKKGIVFMKAVRIHEHGDVNVLQIEEIDRPVPAENEALVKIRTASLNHLDLWARQGIPGIKLPFIPGSDGAGIIEEMNYSESGKFKTGDEVVLMPFRSCGICKYCLNGDENLCKKYRISGEHFDGTMAQYTAVPLKYLLHKPGNLNWAEAAAYPLAFLTAYHMLVKKVALRKDDWVLIWGASSGIGHAAIQIAKYSGARVITTAGSAEKEKFALECGADHVINYTKNDVPAVARELTDGHGADIIFEHVGQKSWQHSLKILARGGRIVTCGATTGPFVRLDLRHIFIKNQQIIGSTMGTARDMFELIELIAQGKIKPHVDRIFPYDNIREAHRYLESGKHMGKVVVSWR